MARSREEQRQSEESDEETKPAAELRMWEEKRRHVGFGMLVIYQLYMSHLRGGGEGFPALLGEGSTLGNNKGLMEVRQLTAGKHSVSHDIVWKKIKQRHGIFFFFFLFLFIPNGTKFAQSSPMK